MSGGIIKDGQVYATKVDIDDTVIANNKTWSSEKISKLNITDAKVVDECPTIADGTITYIKNGTTYTTTNTKQWFYYVMNNTLYQTLFVDGERMTMQSSGADLEEYIKKADLTPVTTDLKSYIDSTLFDIPDTSTVSITKMGRNCQLSIQGISFLSYHQGMQNVAILSNLPEEFRPLVMAECTIYTTTNNLASRGFITSDGYIYMYNFYDSVTQPDEVGGYLFATFNYISAI